VATTRKPAGSLTEVPSGSDKVESDASREARGLVPGTTVTAIVKVTRAGYVPAGVSPRARISPTMFTADLTPEAFERLHQDPLVASIGPTERLRSSKS